MQLKFLFIFVLGLFLSHEAFCLSSPNVSANALFLYRNSNFHKEDADPANLDSAPNGINIQEAELQFYSDVDPYTRLSLLLSIAPSLESDGTNIEEKWGIEPEEAFAESNIIPNVTLKIGKFKAFMGKHNILHTHAYPFIEAPLANIKLLGDEGLNDAGLSAAVLVPTTWFNELTLQYLRGQGENDEFKSPSPGSSVELVHWKNLFDLSEALTMEVGGSYAQGENSFRKKTTLTGADLTFKWRPSEGGRYQSLLWTIEYLGRTQSQDGVDDEKGNGLASWLQYQFAERWSALYRYDTLTIKDTFDLTGLPNDTWKRNSIGLQYRASEFSSFKLEMDQRTGGLTAANGDEIENSIFLQANFTIGAHPAHAY